MRINFHKGARCFEAKKAINHELESHGHGGGVEEDKEGMMMVVVVLIRRRGEDKES